MQLTVYSQEQFFIVEKKHQKLLKEKHKTDKDSLDIIFKKYKRDTVKLYEALDKVTVRLSYKYYEKSEALFYTLFNTPIPNIAFIDHSGKQHSINEIKNKKTIINFNNTSQYFNAYYIDSLLNNKKSNVSIVVLYSEKDEYTNEINKKYADKITLGYISKTEEKMYTLNCGTPSFLFMDENSNYKDFLYLLKIALNNNLLEKISEF